MLEINQLTVAIDFVFTKRKKLICFVNCKLTVLFFWNSFCALFLYVASFIELWQYIMLGAVVVVCCFSIACIAHSALMNKEPRQTFSCITEMSRLQKCKRLWIHLRHTAAEEPKTFFLMERKKKNMQTDFIKCSDGSMPPFVEIATLLWVEVAWWLLIWNYLLSIKSWPCVLGEKLQNWSEISV